MFFWSDKCTVKRRIGFQREWTFTRPSDQPKNHHDIQVLPTRNKQVKQMFWAAFCGTTRRTGLIPLFGEPSSERSGVNRFVIDELYWRVLPTLSANKGAIFQHDNAPIHTTYIVRDTRAELAIEIIEWPRYSPDLNPIENLWVLLKAAIYKSRP